MIKINTAMKNAKVKSTIKYKVFRNKTQIMINQNRISSQAYMVEVKRTDIQVARKELQKTYEGTTQFAFLALKYKHPKAFANALKAQNHYLNTSCATTVQNIPESAAHLVTQNLLKRPQVIDVLQHTRDKHQGKYLVVTTQTAAAEVRAYLESTLEDLVNQTP